MSKGLVAATLLLFSLTSFANTKAELAEAAYAMRDYNSDGVNQVQQAISLYEEAITEETDALNVLEYRGAQASAYYFLGTALAQNNEKVSAHEKAMAIAEEIMAELGVDGKKAHELTTEQVSALLNRLSDRQEVIMAEAMYSRGISLAQWGNLKGISQSISRLPEVLGLMDRIEMMGYQSIHNYGPYRTIGRIKMVLPAIFGGDLQASEQYLKEAYMNTLAAGQRYSVNGYNNIYYAETLYKRGKETQAKRTLEWFLAADVSSLAEGSEPENREALRVAAELYDDWK